MTDILNGEQSVAPTNALSGAELDDIHAWWRAANYLSVGQIYLLTIPCCDGI